MNRPIASGSDIFLPLPLSAASPDSQSRRVAILICSIRGAGSTGVQFSFDNFCIWCVYLALWRNQDPGCIYGMFPMAERRIEVVYHLL